MTVWWVLLGSLAVIIGYIIWCVRSSGKQARRRHLRARYGPFWRTHREIEGLPETRVEEKEKAA